MIPSKFNIESISIQDYKYALERHFTQSPTTISNGMATVRVTASVYVDVSKVVSVSDELKCMDEDERNATINIISSWWEYKKDVSEKAFGLVKEKCDYIFGDADKEYNAILDSLDIVTMCHARSLMNDLINKRTGSQNRSYKANKLRIRKQAFEASKNQATCS